MWFSTEEFTPDERERLAPYFTNMDGPVFALVNLPEVVKGALFARYSRTPKSLRRLFLDEFAEEVGGAATTGTVGTERAEKLYDRVFFEYGDDSVAQLGGVHLACEQASQLLCKSLEWGRLAAYLEQSTRYMRYDDRPGGRWRVTVPPEIEGSALAGPFTAFVDMSFQTYGKLFDPMAEFFRRLYPKDPNDSDFVYRSTITAKTCDTLRNLLPAATRSNVGIYGTGQAYEQLLLRLRAHPLPEMHEYADLMLIELRKVIPAFLKRVDLPDRGVAWSEYLAETGDRTRDLASKLLAGVEPETRDEVTLVDWDPEGEVKVVAAALYAASDLPDDQLLEIARAMSPAEREAAFTAYVGERGNRRHKPGRAFERTQYRFDVLCDYGAFRDLQRHRLLTLEWQRLTTAHAYEIPPEIEEAGFSDDWRSVMDRSDEISEALVAEGLDDAAQYAVAMAYRIRFVMQMNAREAMHVIELRSTPQGHPVYRRVAQQMHRLIDEQAGHHAIAAAMGYADHSTVELERLEAERRTESKRALSDGRG
ncbi:MAG TPA: FAD-dependent thymidylate synthase [Actinomycetota bacterium]|jgi:thymidylate synthase ThyX|nr:FAD-dependent thymidylate synthase [Actinomycetota bacterium]